MRKFHEMTQKPPGHTGDDPRPYWVPPLLINNPHEYYGELFGMIRQSEEGATEDLPRIISILPEPEIEKPETWQKNLENLK